MSQTPIRPEDLSGLAETIAYNVDDTINYIERAGFDKLGNPVTYRQSFTYNAGKIETLGS